MISNKNKIMKKVLFLLLGLVILSTSSCFKEDEETNYLVFGHFYGECEGEECLETYKLTEYQLFEDTNDDYLSHNLNFVSLDQTIFLEVKDLIDFFPEQLLNESKTVFGCPDCSDGGGLLIQYYKNGNLKSWKIDQTKYDVPNYLYPFMDKVNEKITLIHE